MKVPNCLAHMLPNFPSCRHLLSMAGALGRCSFHPLLCCRLPSGFSCCGPRAGCAPSLLSSCGPPTGFWLPWGLWCCCFCSSGQRLLFPKPPAVSTGGGNRLSLQSPTFLFLYFSMSFPRCLYSYLNSSQRAFVLHQTKGSFLCDGGHRKYS